MVPYVIAVGDIGPDEIALLERITEAVALIPDIPDEHISCHAVARLVAPLAPDFRVMDGKCGWTEHSWLQRRGLIIDPYPVAGHRPVMVSTNGFSPWTQIYRLVSLPAATVERYNAELRLVRTGVR